VGAARVSSFGKARVAEVKDAQAGPSRLSGNDGVDRIEPAPPARQTCGAPTQSLVFSTLHHLSTASSILAAEGGGDDVEGVVLAIGYILHCRCDAGLGFTLVGVKRDYSVGD
jgi:hypothetical protein